MMSLEQVLGQWARASATGAPAATPVSLAGRWTNELGSVAEITVDGERLSGTYTSAVGGPAGSVSGPITGFARGDIVAFSVLWPGPLRSLTSWVGQVVEVDGTPQLRTLWHLIVDIPDPEEARGLWTTVHSGADAFR